MTNQANSNHSGQDVKRALSRGALCGACILIALMLGACGTPPAKDFRGSWKPVNRFQSKPTEIPLEQPYTFYAAPMDETLKNMLSRWTRDTGRTLSYQLSYDVTLYKPVADIHTADIDSAATQLNAIYAPQGVLVVALPREITVRSAGTSSAKAEDAAGKSGTSTSVRP